MTLKGHKKHASLEKPKGGIYHRHEWGIIGAPCGIINQLAKDIAKMLPSRKIGFVDAAHNEEKEKSEFHTHYIDKINFHELSIHPGDLTYSFRKLFNSNDFVLVNNNHFTANRQIVIINEKKKESLSRKLDRLTNVACFILDEGFEEVHEFLKDHSAYNPGLPVFKISDISAIADFIEKSLHNLTPQLNGLVLVGGKSERMGQDKSKIEYHGEPHKKYLANILDQYCTDTYYSSKEELEYEQYRSITDSFLDLGPFGGILSAFRFSPNTAWLTIATDIPYLDNETIRLLVEKRNPGKLATCFYNPETKFPEPLITIWEPKAYQVLLYFLSKGYSCPRKVLINSDVEIIKLDYNEVLFNANTPEEMELAKDTISQKSLNMNNS